MLADDVKSGLGEHGRVRSGGEVLVQVGRDPIGCVCDLDPISHGPCEDTLPFLVSVPG